jgi:pimeloyl-ACP methyl ester carboxylesterase
MSRRIDQSGAEAAASSGPRRGTPQSVTTSDGVAVHYDWYPAGSRGMVLVVPGFWRDRSYPSMPRLAFLLNNLGYSAAVIDLRGHGDSGGTYGFNLDEHYDVAAVAEDLLQRTAGESVTLIGFSVGAAIAISTAARHRLPIASLLLISPVADFRRVVPRINPLTMHRHIAFSQALRRPRFDWRFARSPKIRGVDDIPEVKVPVSFIHVKNDWLVDHAHSLLLYEKANEPKELHIIDIPGNYHADRIFSQAGDEIEPLVSDFLLRFTPR